MEEAYVEKLWRSESKAYYPPIPNIDHHIAPIMHMLEDPIIGKYWAKALLDESCRNDKTINATLRLMVLHFQYDISGIDNFYTDQSGIRVLDALCKLLNDDSYT